MKIYNILIYSFPKKDSFMKEACSIICIFSTTSYSMFHRHLTSERFLNEKCVFNKCPTYHNNMFCNIYFYINRHIGENKKNTRGFIFLQFTAGAMLTKHVSWLVCCLSNPQNVPRKCYFHIHIHCFCNAKLIIESK